MPMLPPPMLPLPKRNLPDPTFSLYPGPVDSIRWPFSFQPPATSQELSLFFRTLRPAAKLTKALLPLCSVRFM